MEIGQTQLIFKWTKQTIINYPLQKLYCKYSSSFKKEEHYKMASKIVLTMSQNQLI